MQDKALTPAERDDRTQGAVLEVMLGEHPAVLTRYEIRLRMLPEAGPSFEWRDDVERAIMDLVRGGLAYVSDGSVRPSQAAIRAAAVMP